MTASTQASITPPDVQPITEPSTALAVQPTPELSTVPAVQPATEPSTPPAVQLTPELSTAPAVQPTPSLAPEQGPTDPGRDETPAPDGKGQNVSLEAFYQQHVKNVKAIDSLYHNSLRMCSNLFPMLQGLLHVHSEKYLPLPSELTAHLPTEQGLHMRTVGIDFFLCSSMQYHAAAKAKARLRLVSETLEQYRKSESDAGECSKSELEALERGYFKIIGKINFACGEYNKTFTKFDAYHKLYNRQMAEASIRVDVYNPETGKSTFNY